MTGYELYFTTILSNGDEVELIPGGKAIRVRFSNLKAFITKVVDVRCDECKKQIKAVKRGLNDIFDEKFLKVLSWKDLEYKVVGKEKIEVERLKEITVYRVSHSIHYALTLCHRTLVSPTIPSRSSGRS